MYDKTSMELVKTKDIEIKLKEDYERASYDLEMCRERYGDRVTGTGCSIINDLFPPFQF